MAVNAWSANRVPPEFGFLDPPAAWSSQTHVPVMLDHAGNPLPPVNGSDIRAFPFLPRHLQANLESWEIEWYFRQSSLMNYDDLRARQPAHLGRLTPAQKNGLNNKRHRQARTPNNARCWSNRYHGRPPKTLVLQVESLSQEQLDHNTGWVRVLNGGWHQPGQPHNVVPLFHFLVNGYPHTPSTEVTDAIALSNRLNALATQQGLGHWLDLPDQFLPTEWRMRLRGSRAPTNLPLLGTATAPGQATATVPAITSGSAPAIVSATTPAAGLSTEQEEGFENGEQSKGESSEDSDEESSSEGDCDEHDPGYEDNDDDFSQHTEDESDMEDEDSTGTEDQDTEDGYSNPAPHDEESSSEHGEENMYGQENSGWGPGDDFDEPNSERKGNIIGDSNSKPYHRLIDDKSELDQDGNYYRYLKGNDAEELPDFIDDDDSLDNESQQKGSMRSKDTRYTTPVDDGLPYFAA